MKNTALLVFILSFLLVSCGDDSGSSAGDSNEEAEIFSSSSSKANKSTKFSSSSSVKNKSSSSSSKKAETITDDIQNWKDTTEGAIRKGDVTDIIYIFDNKKWRVATLPEASLGACNEKNEGNFGYAESRIKQDLSKFECILYPESPEDNNCFRIVYNPGYYICKKNRRESPQNRYETIFSWDWKHIRYREYTSICNNPSDDADSKKVNPYWGNFTPVKEKCLNCNQENFDHFEDQCKKRCYVSGNIAHASACVLGFGCDNDLYGTIKEGPSMELASDTIFYEDEYYSEHLYYLSYPISIDSTKKTKYICQSFYYGLGDLHYGWKVATDIDIDVAPAICTSKGGNYTISGKSGTKYVCDNGKFRLATQEEIDAGFACTTELIDQGKCEVNEND